MKRRLSSSRSSSRPSKSTSIPNSIDKPSRKSVKSPSNNPSATTTTTPPTLQHVLSLLQSHSNPSDLAGMARFALSGKRLGVRVPVMRSIAKNIGTNHALANELWRTGYAEARIVATIIADPKTMTVAEIDSWVEDFDSWDVCDQACLNCFRHSPHALDCIARWANAEREFVKRAAFSLIATRAVHEKSASNEHFMLQFPLIERAADDDRNFVKKAVNWALRQIGKRNQVLTKEAIEIARRLKERPEASARWIGSDAMRELEKKIV